MKTRLFLFLLLVSLCNRQTFSCDYHVRWLPGGPEEELLKAEVTPAYSNAVLRAILPEIRQYAAKLELDVAVELESVARFYCEPFKDCSGTVIFRDKSEFYYKHGYVQSFSDARSHYNRESMDRLPIPPDTQVRITAEKAVELARAAIRRLGYSLDQVYANWEPKVWEPFEVQERKVPYFYVRWWDPYSGFPSVKAEIYAENGEVVYLSARGRTLRRRPPKIEVTPPIIEEPSQDIWSVSGAYTNLYLHYMLPKIAAFAVINGLVSAREAAEFASLDSVTHFETCGIRKSIKGVVELKAGFVVDFENGEVGGFATCDSFLVPEGRALPSEWAGPWRLSDEEIIARAEEAVRKAGGAEICGAVDPTVRKPEFALGARPLPRAVVAWNVFGEEQPLYIPLLAQAVAEVDASTGEIKAVRVRDVRKLEPAPDLGVPIQSAPREAAGAVR